MIVRKKLLWVRRTPFDTALDRTTWTGMCHALSELGVDVTLIATYKHKPVPLHEFYRIIWIRSLGTGLIALLSFTFQVWINTLKCAIKEKCDWIILDMATFLCAFPLDLLGRIGISKTKVILDLRTFSFGFSDKRTLRDTFWELIDTIGLKYGRFFHSGLTVIVPALAEEAKRRGGNQKICIWPSGCQIPSSLNGPVVDNDVIARLTSLSSGNFLVMYHGLLSRHRGLYEAIEGVAIARSRGCPVFFVLIGDGKEASRLAQFIQDRKYDSACQIFPAIPHSLMFEAISYARLGVMTYPAIDYWTYNFPLKLAEYLSMGKPVVCTDIPMFRNSVSDQNCLIKIPSNQPEEIANKLEEMISHMGELSSRESSARTEARNLAWDRLAGKLLVFLNSL